MNVIRVVFVVAQRTDIQANKNELEIKLNPFKKKTKP